MRPGYGWWAAVVALCAGVLPAQPAPAPPASVAGPFTVTVERLVQNWHFSLLLEPGPHGEAPLFARRGGQLYLTVRARDLAAARGLWSLTVTDVVVDNGTGTESVACHGNALDDSADDVLRVVVHLPTLSLRARSLRCVDGELDAFARGEVYTVAFPLSGPTLPTEKEIAGVRVRLREFSQRGQAATVRLAVVAPPGAQVVSPVDDQSCGLRLQGESGEEAVPTDGTPTLRPDGSVEYVVHFRNVPSAPRRLEARLLLRSGPRRRYSFRLKDLPLPAGLLEPAPGAAT